MAEGVVRLCSNNSGKYAFHVIYWYTNCKRVWLYIIHTDLLRVAELDMKISSIEGLPALKVMV